MCISFPPCTHLAVSVRPISPKKGQMVDNRKLLIFFMLFTRLNHIPKVCIENPVGIMSTYYENQIRSFSRTILETRFKKQHVSG